MYVAYSKLKTVFVGGGAMQADMMVTAYGAVAAGGAVAFLAALMMLGRALRNAAR